MSIYLEVSHRILMMLFLVIHGLPIKTNNSPKPQKRNFITKILDREEMAPTRSVLEDLWDEYLSWIPHPLAQAE
jgi:hypothetical protein